MFAIAFDELALCVGNAKLQQRLLVAAIGAVVERLQRCRQRFA
ncbi:hypothetical protein [Erythrobacter sp.]